MLPLGCNEFSGIVLPRRRATAASCYRCGSLGAALSVLIASTLAMQCAISRRTVCIEYENGDKLFSEGEPGFERGIRFDFFNGDRFFYDGGKGLERLKRIEWASGHVSQFEGARGEEQEVLKPRALGTFRVASKASKQLSSARASQCTSPVGSWNERSLTASHGVVLLGPSPRESIGSKSADASASASGAAELPAPFPPATAPAAPTEQKTQQESAAQGATSRRRSLSQDAAFQQGPTSSASRTSVTLSHPTTPGLLSERHAERARLLTGPTSFSRQTAAAHSK